MAAASASPEAWEAIRTASIKGVDDDMLAITFGVTKNAIWSRRYDDPAWSAAVKDRTLALRGKKRDIPVLDKEEVAKTVAAVSALSLQQIAEENSLLLARYTHGKIRTAAESDLLPAPSDWSQLKTASEILRKATGQDKDQAPVTLNLFGSSSFGEPEGAVIDLPVETQEAEEGDFC